MPDGHLGYTMPIGGVIGTEDYLVPTWVGYDIGCGVIGAKTTYDWEEVKNYGQEIFDTIRRSIPMGFNHRTHAEVWHSNEVLPKSEWMKEMFKEKKGLRQIGTLGGGNHFIEIGVSDLDQFVWIIIHSGSRGIGHACATHYIKKAHPEGKCKEGTYGFNDKTEEGRDYYMDMNFCLRFALWNRRKMVDEVDAAIQESLGIGKLVNDSIINCNHNLASWDDKLQLWLHRKGATVATKDTLGVIPANMRDGSFIVRGLGNVHGLYSCSHGAGRVMSRNEAKGKVVGKEGVCLEKFKADMSGVVSNREERILDESPDAYKSISKVMRAQHSLVEVVEYIKPIINIKA
jgi:tRNA-splicing ligase RtcB